ncbi:hypothetical protein OHC33_003337 [Knufia fluminis]|uniref:Uncharacterized protein n=1 Tax=Knufia fluminis TaxID=191047 RepID=A0AAN8EXB8_9EURO|nr:hypothetical protein OHC33_003337 [Knufia fluminis]
MTRWISLKVGWKLQDVQAGLNVCIAFLCAGGIFVLVRYCWLLAARRVTQKREVAAYRLLSLNTIGESIDVIWLLRHELFTRRYHGLLLQVVCVMLLTVATLMSGFIARFSTRYGTVVRDVEVNGTIARRNYGNLPFAEVETNLTMFNLQRAQFPQTQIPEYIPDQSEYWEYSQAQWNSSWAMDCQYNRSTPIPDPVASDDCSNFLWTQTPFVMDNWSGWDFDKDDTYYHSTWWSNDQVLADWLVFFHGVQYNDGTDDFWTDLTVQTVAYYFQGSNATVPDECDIGPGDIAAASYTSMTCRLRRSLGNRPTEDLAEWGAYPDAVDAKIQASAYLQHYANRFRRESSRKVNITIIEGEELAMFYQAYVITKDTSNAPSAHRTISVHVDVAQISLPCLIACTVAAGIVLFGLFNYWIFLFRNWSRLEKTPQSKLDWMLHTLRKESDDRPTSRPDIRKRLSSTMASGAMTSEAVPLTKVATDQKGDRISIQSTPSSTFSSMPTPELPYGDDGFETPILGANFSPGRAPTNTWFPQQYERVSPYARQNSWNAGSRNGDYNPVQQQSPYNWQSMGVGTHHIDTAYDRGKV